MKRKRSRSAGGKSAGRSGAIAWSKKWLADHPEQASPPTARQDRKPRQKRTTPLEQYAAAARRPAEDNQWQQLVNARGKDVLKVRELQRWRIDWLEQYQAEEARRIDSAIIPIMRTYGFLADPPAKHETLADLALAHNSVPTVESLREFAHVLCRQLGLLAPKKDPGAPKKYDVLLSYRVCLAVEQIMNEIAGQGKTRVTMIEACGLLLAREPELCRKKNGVLLTSRAMQRRYVAARIRLDAALRILQSEPPTDKQIDSLGEADRNTLKDALSLFRILKERQ